MKASELRNKFIMMIEGGCFNNKSLAVDLVAWFSPDDVVDFCLANGIELEEEEEQDA